MEVLKGKEIKIARIKAGISQAKLAKEINVSVPHLSYVESGKRESYKVRVLATEYFNKKS